MMKKVMKLIAICAIVATALSSCTKSDDNGGGERGGEFDLGDGTTDFELTSDITLTYPNTYFLKGFVYVPAGRTITIEPGVVIKGDKESDATLIIERGGKIMARGTASRPIVFTSSKPAGSRAPGDWGGIIILGKARNNIGEMTIEGGVRSKHGGSDDTDNSGVLSYVRCEFAGVEYGVDNEINGITFGSVGSGTQVDHIQVSYSGDDAFEWFGGSVNAKYLVSYSTWDDDFDTDNGYNGKVQFGVVLRNPMIADKSASNGFESDNWKDGTPTSLSTKPIFSNMSVFGPVTDPTSYTDQGATNGSSTAVFQSAIQIRRSSQLNLFNSVVAGFPLGLIIENDKSGSNTQEMATAGNSNISGCVMAGMIHNYQDKATNTKPVYDATKGETFVKEYFENAPRSNKKFVTIAELGLQGNPQNLKAPNMIPAQGSVLASGAVWSHANLSGMTQTTYIGAFAPSESAANNWTSGWCEFDPQNKVY